MDKKDVIDVDPIETNKKESPKKDFDPLHAWAYFLFFLPYCRKEKSKNLELDNWYANQGLLNLIAWAAGGLISGSILWYAPFWGIIVQVFNALILANAIYGTVSYYQEKPVRMLVYGDIRIIQSKVKDPA